MPLTPNIGLNRPPHGDYLNVWDQPVNQNWDLIDGLFSGNRWDTPPTGPGHTHDGTTGRGPKIRHTDLLDIGTKTHPELDAAFSKTKVSAVDTTPDFLEPKFVAGTNVVLTKLNPGANEQLQINVPSVSVAFGDPSDPSGEYGWKHFVPTSAPVAYTDNFTYPSGFTLRQADYTVQRSSGGSLVFPDFFATGYSAALFVDPSLGDDTVGKYAATVSCQIPHGPAQRATCGITDFNVNDLDTGDFFAFTLSVFSTHRVGTALPQKHGVLLEVHLVCLSPGVFQMTHRILVLPDAVLSNQVVLYQHQHSNPADMKGAWEISLDANGHIYHYWRRKLVHSTQSSPPNVPGPVQAYFAQLMASLLADGDEKYGAMGFGFHYGIKPTSKFNFEFRWLTVTADADIYDETPVCPGTADPYGVVETFDLPEEFFIVPAVVPGAECCPAPNARNVGDILESDPVTGEPLVWIKKCCQLPDDQESDGVMEGYETNISPLCLPCPSPTGDPSSIRIFDLTGYWPEVGPEEGTIGKIVLHGVFNIPPLVIVTSTNLFFTIIDVVWLSYGEIEIKYLIIDGGGGTVIDLEITNAVDSVRTFSIPSLATIQTREPEILSATWLDLYLYSLVEPTGGYKCEATLTGRGFKFGTILSTPTAGVTVDSFVVDSATQITAQITFDFVTSGLPFTLSVHSLGVSPLDYTHTVAHPVPLLAYVELNPPPNGPDIGAGKSATFFGNFFAGMPPLMTIVPVDPTQIANLVIVSVTQTQIDITFDIIAPGGVTPLLEFLITNVVSGLNEIAPVCEIGNSIPLTLTPPAIPDPDPVYTAGRKPAASGYPPNYYDTVVSGGMVDAVYTLLSGPAVGPLYGTPGDSHTHVRGPLGVMGQYWLKCLENLLVDISIIKPGVGVASIIGAFPTADPPTPVASGSPAFSTPAVPGASGTVDFLFSAGLTYLTDISAVSDLGVTFSNRTSIPGGLRYDFAIASNVVPTTSVDVTFWNDVCDLGTNDHSFTVEYNNPVITSIDINLYEDVQNNVGIIKGVGFVAGTSIIVGGNITYVSHVDVDSETITLTINNGVPGGATVQVQNPDGKLSNVFPLTLLTELAADVDHVDMVPSTTGAIGATLYIYGDHLFPPGVGLAFTGFTPTAPPVYHNDSYIEQVGDITAVGGASVTMDVTSTSHSYLGLFLAKATASPGGDVIITSIDNREPKDNQTGFITTVFGDNMDLIDSVEAIPTDPVRLAIAYQPIGGTPAVTVSIIGKTVDHITLSVDLEKGLAYNQFDFAFYDAFLVLLATAPAAIEAQPSNNAADISKATRVLLDAAIPSAAGAGPWNVVIPVSDFLFGDEIVASSGWTPNGTPTYSGGQWTVNGTNTLDPPGTPWELLLNRPGALEWTVYRIGVLT